MSTSLLKELIPACPVSFPSSFNPLSPQYIVFSVASPSSTRSAKVCKWPHAEGCGPFGLCFTNHVAYSTSTSLQPASAKRGIVRGVTAGSVSSVVGERGDSQAKKPVCQGFRDQKPNCLPPMESRLDGWRFGVCSCRARSFSSKRPPRGYSPGILISWNVHNKLHAPSKPRLTASAIRRRDWKTRQGFAFGTVLLQQFVFSSCCCRHTSLRVVKKSQVQTSQLVFKGFEL